MNRLPEAFERLARSGRKALLPYITGGFPDAATTVAILKRIDPQVCACVEVGIPFSDPIADGPVIQASFATALERGFRLDTLFEALGQARDAIAVPLLAMVSYSVVYRRDPQQFVAQARAAGFDGLIVPDLAFEEAENLARIAQAAECPLVLMVAPTTADDRRARIAALSEPFIYYQSLAGVTGERTALPADLTQHVQELRRAAQKPVCVGFGIATAEHVRTVCAVAHGAIVGSAIVRQMNEAVARHARGPDIAELVLGKIAALATGLV